VVDVRDDAKITYVLHLNCKYSFLSANYGLVLLIMRFVMTADLRLFFK
jgi:hypothetical protein